MDNQHGIQKEKPIAKRRIDKAEKLFLDRKARPTRRALARKKEVGLPALCSSYFLPVILTRKLHFLDLAST